MDDFRDLRWVPLQPKLIDYPNAQFMMLGEAQGRLGKGGKTEEKAPGEENAGEELENLEHEDEIRAGSLEGKLTYTLYLQGDVNKPFEFFLSLGQQLIDQLAIN